MKKKIIIISICVLLVALLCIYFLTRPNVLGNINQTFIDKETGSSDISFYAESGDRIKFSFKSEIESGILEIILCDSNGDVVYELDRAKELETFFTFEKADKYFLKSEYSDFIGKYSITVYKMD